MAGLVAATEWSNLTVAGAFLVGAAMATIATIRVVKHVTNYYASVERKRTDGDEPPPSPSSDSPPVDRRRR